MRSKLILLCAVCLSLLSFKHEYHVSITQIDYNTESTTLQIAMKLHIEDVEFMIEKKLKNTGNLEKDLQNKAVENYLYQYIETSFKLFHEESVLDFKFVGREFEDDDMWVYMETSKFEEMPDLKVENTLFLELFQDQSNLVHYSKDNQVVLSTALNKQKRSHSFAFE